MKRVSLLAAMLASFVVAPSSQAHDHPSSAKLDLVMTHAGAPVSEAKWLSSSRGLSFEALDDQSLLLWVSRSRAYLVEVSDSCFVASSPMAIAATSRIRVQEPIRTVGLSGFMQGSAGRGVGAGNQGQSCLVREIRPVDAVALKAARNQNRTESVIEAEVEQG